MRACTQQPSSNYIQPADLHHDGIGGYPQRLSKSSDNMTTSQAHSPRKNTNTSSTQSLNQYYYTDKKN